MVALGHHILSDHFGGVAGVHYKANVPPTLLGAVCTYFILQNITVLQLGQYIAIWQRFYVLKYYLVGFIVKIGS